MPTLIRDMEKPRHFALLLARQLRLEHDPEAIDLMAETIKDSMHEALNFAADAARRDGKWASESIDGLKMRVK
jgi:hypothetical protein